MFRNLYFHCWQSAIFFSWRFFFISIQCTILCPQSSIQHFYYYCYMGFSRATRPCTARTRLLRLNNKENKALRAHNSNFRESQLSLSYVNFLEFSDPLKQSHLIYIYNLLLHSYVCTRTGSTKHTLTFHIFTVDRKEGARP